MFLRKASPDEIRSVALEMRQRDYEEILCVTWSEGREELAEYLVHCLSDHENVYSFGDTEAVGVVSYIPLRPGVWSLGLFATDKFQKVSTFLTKRVIRDIIPALDNAKAHRVEAQSIDGYKQVHRWLEFIGLKKENVIPGFGRNGETFINFAYVRSLGAKPGTLKWRRPGVIN